MGWRLRVIKPFGPMQQKMLIEANVLLVLAPDVVQSHLPPGFNNMTINLTHFWNWLIHSQ